MYHKNEIYDVLLRENEKTSTNKWYKFSSVIVSL